MKKDRANPVRFAVVVFQRSVSYVVKNESNTNSKLRQKSVLAFGLGVLRQNTWYMNPSSPLQLNMSGGCLALLGARYVN